eukprot:IDg17380t1
MDSEEHNAKLVFVMHRAWEEFGHRSLFREAARHFTNTPRAARPIRKRSVFPAAMAHCHVDAVKESIKSRASGAPLAASDMRSHNSMSLGAPRHRAHHAIPSAPLLSNPQPCSCTARRRRSP